MSVIGQPERMNGRRQLGEQPGRAVVLVDGEHYPPVVRDAVASLPQEVVGALLVGGTEKLRGERVDYGVPILQMSIEAALAQTGATTVVDLSDVPVLSAEDRLRLANRIIACGATYEGADFSFRPPTLIPFSQSSISVVGTGKRVGKTAFVTYAASHLGQTRNIMVVSMGRGGPDNPDLITYQPDVADLLKRSRSGQHAASDYLEHAALANIPSVGCRRCGGGLAGSVNFSNVVEGAKLAASHNPDMVIFDGSGTAIPPVATTRRILVVSALQSSDVITDYLNPYRLLTADLVILTMAEHGLPYREFVDLIQKIRKIPVIPVRLRPHPLQSIADRSIAFFSTAPRSCMSSSIDHLHSMYRTHIVHVSENLARRDLLVRELEGVKADALLVELKAAAIDTVAEYGATHNIPVILCGHDVLGVPGYSLPDDALSYLADEL